MKIKRYCGNYPAVLHAAPEYAIVDHPLSISAAYRVFGENAPERLVLRIEDGKDFYLLPCDRYERKGVTYVVYRVDIPASSLKGDVIVYRIDAEGETTPKLPPYKCKLISLDNMPELSPLVITEIFARPKGKDHTCYIEYFNPTDKPVDLYDYELLVYANTQAPDYAAVGEPKGRIPLSRAAGANILGAGESAAVWGLTLKNYAPEVNSLTPDDLIRDINTAYLYTKEPIDEARARILPIDLTEIDPESGERKNLAGISSLPNGHDVTTLLIVPRGGDASSAVFTLVYSNCYAEWDTPVHRSSYWTFDPFEPRKAVNLSHAELATPGYPCHLETGVYNPTAALPVILPLSPIKEAYHGDYCGIIEFVVLPSERDNEVGRTMIKVTLPNGEKAEYEALEEHDGVRRARIPEEVFEELSELEYEISAYDGAREVRLGNVLPLRVPVYDNRGPRITDMIPTRGYAFDGTKPIVIKASYTDPAGIRIKDCYLRVDGKDVTNDTTITATSLIYEPKKPLEVGKHSLTIRLKDGLGNRTTRTVDFTVSDMSELNAYFGEIHAHTGDSDGNGRGRDAIEFAYDNGADFFAVTEHSHYFTQKVYDEQKAAAKSLDRPGRFAALYGWEMTWNNTCGYWGHMNVIGSEKIVSDIHSVNMPDLFKWLEGEPNAVGMFNHPGNNWGDFEDYGFRTPEADKQMALAEIKGRGYDQQYALLLSRGWHVAPAFNEDNHAPNWTIASPYITGVLAPALTRANIMDAFRARRVYSSADPTMKIFYKINGEWMGSRLDNPDELHISVKITTENENGIGLIEIIGEDNIVVTRKFVGARQSYEWNTTLPVEFDYYYLRISNGAQYSVTAPVWIENRSEPKVLSMTRSASYDPHESSAVTIKFENPTDKVMTEVKVDFYLTGVEGFSLRDAVPYAKVCIGKLKPGRSMTVTRQLPEISKNRRVSAIISAVSDNAVKKATAYILVSPVSITEVLCATAPLEIDGNVINNPFPYVTLCNNSGNDITLRDSKISLWTITGKPPKDENVWSADGITIPARSAVVIWYRKPDHAALTVDDFNRRYATALIEGQSIYICEKPITSRSTAGRRLDLSISGEIVSRVTWNMGLRYGQTAEVDEAYKYRFSCDMSPLGIFCGTGIPTPGMIDYKQLGARKEVEPTAKELKSAKKQNKVEQKRAKHKSKIKYTAAEAGAIAAGSAALAAFAAAGITKLISRKK
ncbi:MAG: CehA/McbA family metallohydrolase [Clostridia bacterium]|nr:CehA/McbA family metallohydrolase [Clostridia bacterium]